MPADGSPIISRGGTASAPRGTVLVIEDDRALGRLLDDLLSEVGYAVALLQNVREEPVRDAVARLEPDCILLDSEGMAGYTQSWIDAAWIRERERPVPVVMFTVDSGAAAEALAAESERSRRAAFFAVLAKPFDLDILLDTVARAVATSAGAAPADGSSGPPAAHPLDTGVGAGDWGAREAREDKPAPAPRTAQFGRRHRLEQLRREVARLREALRHDRAEYLALEGRTAGRALTAAERSLARELRSRAETHRRRLEALRDEFVGLT